MSTDPNAIPDPAAPADAGVDNGATVDPQPVGPDGQPVPAPVDPPQSDEAPIAETPAPADPAPVDPQPDPAPVVPDAPADAQPAVDGQSGAIITGEDAAGNPLTTEDVAAATADPAVLVDADQVEAAQDPSPAAMFPPAAPSAVAAVQPDPTPADVTETTVTWDGVRAIDTVKHADGSETVTQRPATLEEQLDRLAPEILRTVIGMLPTGGTGSITTSATGITITVTQ